MDVSNTDSPCPKAKEIVAPPPLPLEKLAAGRDPPRVIPRLVPCNGRGASDATSEGGAAVPLPSQHRGDTNASGRERLKRHREEVAGRVAVPDNWGHEGFLVDWLDCKAFDALLAPKGIDSAREALVAEGRRARAVASRRLRIEGRC
ncbi:hypothetical protein MLD38_017233 [Melastoma candidum]|uniref:Uncharacterized protein n=1 Tax=Melastoma candidum TaxID=119954 RepID=A0ACB9QT25_9MYRT|nr:hypothetical protein MLD38_017233 [Melastoma candidum]